MTCTWTPDPDTLDDKWDSLVPDRQERYLMLATSALQGLTLNRVGTCPITIRPVLHRSHCGCPMRPWVDYSGLWRNSCPHNRAYGLSPASEVDLDGPVGAVLSIKIDGHEKSLTNGDWRMDNGHILVWQGDGPSPLPNLQDLSKPDTEVGTWSITYSQSYPVLKDARIAVALLAMEMSKADQPKGKCSLPRGVTSVVRNGVTFEVEGAGQLFPNGLTGIDLVDQFIIKWVPAGTPQRSAQVFDPRAYRPRRTSLLPLGSGAPVGPTDPIEDNDEDAIEEFESALGANL